jgi:hypothetical protein
MKKIVAIMAVSLMILASCGKTNDIIGSGLKGDRKVSENKYFRLNNAPAADKTLWENYSLGICVGSLVGICSVVLLIGGCCWDGKLQTTN